MFLMANISDWLHGELNKRKWSQADLSRNTGLSRAAISNLISGKRGLGKDTAISIAQALNIPLEDVLRAAGDLPTIIDESPIVREINHTSKQLDKSEQAEILEIIKMKLRLAKSRGKNEKVSRPAK